VNAFTVAAAALIAGLVPLLGVAFVRRPIDGLVALELASSIGVLTLLCLAEGFHRGFEFELGVIGAVSSWIGGLVVARFLGRWL
jgi:multisubunit Na+/H+ antiporter MnhF subunit